MAILGRHLSTSRRLQALDLMIERFGYAAVVHSKFFSDVLLVCAWVISRVLSYLLG